MVTYESAQVTVRGPWLRAICVHQNTSSHVLWPARPMSPQPWHEVVVVCRVQEAYRLQLRCFLGLVSEQRHLPSLKQLLRLYTAISLPKLASLMDMDEPTLRSQLMLLKVCLQMGFRGSRG